MHLQPLFGLLSQKLKNSGQNVEGKGIAIRELCINDFDGFDISFWLVQIHHPTQLNLLHKVNAHYNNFKGVTFNKQVMITLRESSIFMLFIGFVLWNTLPASAQEFNFSWVNTAQNYYPNNGGVDMRGMTTDQNGNTYLTGDFTYGNDFAPGPEESFEFGFNSSSSPQTDVFIVKLNSQNEYVWSLSFGANFDDGTHDIAVDDMGNIYVCGFFRTTVDFDPSEGSTTLNAFGDRDAFLAKYDSNGVFQWVKQMGSSGGDDEAISVALDQSNQAIVTGSFYETLYFDENQSDSLTSVDGRDIFVVKYDVDGNRIWHQHIGGGKNDQPNQIHVDDNNEVVLMGTYNDSLFFYSDTSFTAQPDTLVSYGVDRFGDLGWGDAFMVKFSEDGSFQWSKGIGGTADDVGGGIGTDSLNNIYLSVMATSTVHVADDTVLSLNNRATPIIAKFSPSGDLTWIHALESSSFFSQTFEVAVSAAGNLHIGGFYYFNSPDFDPSSNVFQTPAASGLGYFAAKYDTDGNFEWAKAQTNDSFDGYQDQLIALTASGDVLSAGTTYEDLAIDGSSDIIRITKNAGFLVNYDTDGNYIRHSQIGDLGYKRNFESVCDVTTDEDRNVYVIGYFSNKIDMDPSADTFYLTTGSARLGIFVAKYNVVGKLVWAYQLEGNRTPVTVAQLEVRQEGLDILTDHDGNLVISGDFSGNVDFDLSNDTLMLDGQNQGFLAKYTPDASLIWAKALIGTGTCQPTDLVIGPDNALYQVGHFNGTIDFDPSDGEENLTAGRDLYLSKFTQNGDLIWAKHFANTYDVQATRMAIDEHHNLFLSQAYVGTVDLDPSTGVATFTSVNTSSNIKSDVFLAKYDSSGSYQWGFSIGASESEYLTGLKADNGNVYMQLMFTRTLNVNPRGTTTELSPHPDLALLKYDSDGKLIWLKQYGRINFNHVDVYGDLNLDNEGNVYVTGSVLFDADFDLETGEGFLEGNAARDIYVAKYDSDGNYLMANRMHTTDQYLGDITIDAYGAIIIGGGLDADFHPDPNNPSYTLPHAIQTDMFVARYLQCTPDTTYLDATFCTGGDYTSPSGLCTWNVAGTYTDIMLSSTGCDSVFIIELRETEFNTILSFSNDTLYVAESDADSYQWIDCDNGNTPIAGATEQFLVINKTGNYAVQMIKNGCNFTSECLPATFSSLNDELGGATKLMTYPNPTNHKVTISVDEPYQEMTVILKNTLGQTIKSTSFKSHQEAHVGIDGPSGIYFLQVRLDGKQISTQRIIKY